MLLGGNNMNLYKNMCLKVCSTKSLRILLTTLGTAAMIVWDILFLVLGFNWAHVLFIIPALTMIVVVPGDIMRKNIKGALIYISIIIFPAFLFARVMTISDASNETSVNMFAIFMIIYAILYLIDINTSKE